MDAVGLAGVQSKCPGIYSFPFVLTPVVNSLKATFYTDEDFVIMDVLDMHIL